MGFLKKQENQNPNKKAKRLLKFAVVFVLAVLFVELWTVNRLSTYGEKIQSLKEAQARIELENQVLENTIAQEASLHVIEKRASVLGFESVKNFQYLNSRNLASLR